MFHPVLFHNSQDRLGNLVWYIIKYIKFLWLLLYSLLNQTLISQNYYYFSLQYGLIKSFIIYFSSYLNGIIFNSILSYIQLNFSIIFLSKFSSSQLLGWIRVIFWGFSILVSYFSQCWGVQLSHLSWFPPHLTGFFGRVMSLVIDTVVIGQCCSFPYSYFDCWCNG